MSETHTAPGQASLITMATFQGQVAQHVCHVHCLVFDCLGDHMPMASSTSASDEGWRLARNPEDIVGKPLRNLQLYIDSDEAVQRVHVVASLIQQLTTAIEISSTK